MGNFRLERDGPRASFRARGASLSDLFETCAKAMFSLEYDLSTVGFDLEINADTEADDLDALLETWLALLLDIHHSQGFVAGDFIVVEVGEPPLRRAGERKVRIRANARGRMTGPWFSVTGAKVASVRVEHLDLSRPKRGFAATVEVECEPHAP